MKTTPAVAMFLILAFAAVPIYVFVRTLWIYWLCGREPEQGSAIVQYDPPDNLTPGECGALLENAVSVRDITATIVDLSVRGYLSIDQTDGNSNPSKEGRKSYVFHIRKGLAEWHVLKSHEKKVLAAIFNPTNPLRMLSDAMSSMQSVSAASPLAPLLYHVQEMIAGNSGLRTLAESEGEPRSVVSFLDLQSQFYLHLALIRDAIFDELVARGYYTIRPDRVRLLHIAKGIVAGAVMAGSGAVAAAAIGTAQLPWILTGTLTGVIILAFSGLMSARTIAGSRALAKVLGFREFLGRVEKDRVQRLQRTPDLFEKYLPYAMALHVEENWTKVFDDVSVPPPQWYQRKYGSGFLPRHLVDDLSAMSNEAENERS